MKVAIIEDGSRSLVLSDPSINQWDIDYFKDPVEFGHADLSRYDVVVTECSLPTMSGRDLIKSISGKTHAQMFLMGDSSGVFSTEDINNKDIKGFIVRTYPESLINQLRYVDSKIRINKLIEQESNKINGIIQNGYRLEIHDNTGVLELNSLPVTATVEKIGTEVAATKVKGIVIYFSEDTLGSNHLGVLVALYKKMKDLQVKMAFWNKSGRKYIEKMMLDCNLDKLYSIHSNLEEAKASVI